MTLQSVKDNWVKIIMGLISAGFIGQVIGFWDLKLKREDAYIEKYVNCNESIIELNTKLNEVTNRLNTIELASTDIPFPFWIKDLNSTILFVNKAYKQTILRPLNITDSEFINTKGEALGEDFRKTIVSHDRKVIVNLEKMEFRETVPEIGSGTSYKYPLFGNSGYVIGTSGIWIPDTAFK